MKRQTAMALAAVFAMSVAGTALAAPANPFTDVPAKHWAYDSINKLAKSGVISGYGDGTFKGDKTLTRYEIAVIVGKALANSDKADADTKKTLEALKAEFGAELNNLGVRVDNLEKNASKVKFTGEVRARYEYSDDSTTNKKNYEKTRVRLSMTAPIDENVTFKGRFHSESSWGVSGTGIGPAPDTNNTVLDQAYITGKIFDGAVTYNFGRQPSYLGQGLLYDNSQNNDGLVVTAGKDVKVTAGAFKYSTWNFVVGNIDFKLNDKLNLTASYLADDADGAVATGNLYKSTAAGLKYTGLKNFTVSGEYAQNDSDWANLKNAGDAAKAWAGKIKYRGAKASEAKSYGVWVGYRKADENFDKKNVGTLDMANGMDAVYLLENDNVKGLEYGFDYAVFKNGILTIQYNDLEENKGTRDKRNLIAQLVYSF
ncbi:S-layer homology domain-containing protein [Sporomusa sp.]|uniref:S-layer homology domain-containing protein n=1 Tax=Sporomusa sp. TaxID=2078658 RepID=UPI002C3CCDA2|nr:S-layer homology domain-containing protein [Sporomusa sp.]HWR44311.1 S-layer homology domain-containing protein [Sporomusa sp.]